MQFVHCHRYNMVLYRQTYITEAKEVMTPNVRKALLERLLTNDKRPLKACLVTDWHVYATFARPWRLYADLLSLNKVYGIEMIKFITTREFFKKYEWMINKRFVDDIPAFHKWSHYGDMSKELQNAYSLERSLDQATCQFNRLMYVGVFEPPLQSYKEMQTVCDRLVNNQNHPARVCLVLPEVVYVVCHKPWRLYSGSYSFTKVCGTTIARIGNMDDLRTAYANLKKQTSFTRETPLFTHYPYYGDVTEKLLTATFQETDAEKNVTKFVETEHESIIDLLNNGKLHPYDITKHITAQSNIRRIREKLATEPLKKGYYIRVAFKSGMCITFTPLYNTNEKRSNELYTLIRSKSRGKILKANKSEVTQYIISQIKRRHLYIYSRESDQGKSSIRYVLDILRIPYCLAKFEHGFFRGIKEEAQILILDEYGGNVSAYEGGRKVFHPDPNRVLPSSKLNEICDDPSFNVKGGSIELTTKNYMIIVMSNFPPEEVYDGDPVALSSLRARFFVIDISKFPGKSIFINPSLEEMCTINRTGFDSGGDRAPDMYALTNVLKHKFEEEGLLKPLSMIIDDILYNTKEDGGYEGELRGTDDGREFAKQLLKYPEFASYGYASRVAPILKDYVPTYIDFEAEEAVLECLTKDAIFHVQEDHI